MVFADAERKMIRSRVQEGIDAAIADGDVAVNPRGWTARLWSSARSDGCLASARSLSPVHRGRPERTASA
jgi:hypothetical protein